MVNVFNLLLVTIIFASWFTYIHENIIVTARRAKVYLPSDKQRLFIISMIMWSSFAVGLLRFGLVETYIIPSDSMLPTLKVGDRIHLDKHTLGLKDPLFNKSIMKGKNPERFDIIVFKLPNNESTRYIKRVIGIPGDRLRYNTESFTFDIKAAGNGGYLKEKKLNNGQYEIQVTSGLDKNQFLFKPADEEWIVPEGMLLVAGDNRNQSIDGRYWGFLSAKNVIGTIY